MGLVTRAWSHNAPWIRSASRRRSHGDHSVFFLGSRSMSLAWFSFGYFWVTQANASRPQFSAVWRACLAIWEGSAMHPSDGGSGRRESLEAQQFEPVWMGLSRQ